ncbi:nucleotidyltransferase domain-containing protein [Streptomyces parvus]|uniref:nucleotidyltransferase domain-containing protein n=1 Tax=Streptomyces parvus TaxID=66428 RepID=UPI0036291D26
MSATGPESQVLRLLARPELTEEQKHEARGLIEDNLSSFDWGFLLDQATRHNVLQMLGKHFADLRYYYFPDQRVIVPHWWVLCAAYQANTIRNENLSAEYGQVLALLNEAGVRYAVRKGAALGEHLYPDPGLRRTSDLDLLIERTDARRVAEILTELGYEQGRIAPDGKSVQALSKQAQGFWRLHVNNAMPFHRIPGRSDIPYYGVDMCFDLFQRGSGSASPVPELLDRSTAVELCGVPSAMLSLPDQLIDTCAHLFKEATNLYYIEHERDLQLSKFLDVALLADRVTRSGGWEQTVARVREYQAVRQVYFALHFTDLLFPGEIAPEVLAELRPADCSYLEEYGGGGQEVFRWGTPFLDRLFDRKRRSRTAARSVVPTV